MLTHDVEIWFRATDALDQAAIAAAVSVLSEEERAQYLRFHIARDARDYAAAHALLRRALSLDDGREPERWRFDRAAGGKPFLVDAGGFRAAFSLSHTHGMVACAVTAGADVGVDVECIDREVNVADIAARFFAPSERDVLSRLDPYARRSRFFDLWTLKEALVKALGIGIATSLASLIFTVDAAGGVTLEASDTIGADAWQFGLFAPGPRHRLAVAVRRSPSHTAKLILRSLVPDA